MSEKDDIPIMHEKGYNNGEHGAIKCPPLLG